MKIVRLYTTAAGFLKVLKCRGTASAIRRARLPCPPISHVLPASPRGLYPRFHLCYNAVIDLTPQPLSDASPHDDLVSQDVRFASAFHILSEAIRSRAFPACSLAVTHSHKLVALRALGHFTYDSDAPGVTLNSLFDIASVTKVVGTTAMAMILYERGLLDLDLPVAAIVPEFISPDDPRRREVSLRMLLAHSSGLPAYEKLFLRARSRDDLLNAAFTTELTADPDSRAEYSDIGFIILGVALERVADETLDLFCQREVFGPLGMIATTCNPAPSYRPQCVPTANDESFRRRIIQGEVQDENASVLGGVAGHAGLFSTARDLARFSQAMLDSGRPILRAESLAAFTARHASPPGTSRALGWDTPSAPSQSGRYFSPYSFGHLGYTGCSLWIDPVRQLSIALLTNRTWPDCRDQSIKQVRPRVHDAIVEALEKSA